VCTADVISEVGVDILSVRICRRDLITKTFASTNVSCNICKKRVLTSELDSAMLEYRNDIRAIDDIPEVEVYMLSIWMYRRGLSTKTSYITYVSHNYKLQMCPDEAFVDMAVTE